MKNLIIIASVLLISVGCVTVPPAVSVIDKCKAEYFNEYYGDCIFQTYETHPNRDAYLNAYNYRADWMEITQTNRDILSLLSEDKITIDSANKVFMVKFNALYQKDLARAAEFDKALQDFTDTMNDIADNQAARAGAMYGGTGGRGVTYFKDSEYVAGFNKICVYKFGTTKTTRTIPSTSLCPLSVKE
jgi:hypothetical protein